MRRKRLNHIAFTLCHMFCGWQLYDDFPALTKLGNGTLHIDLKTQVCHFNGKKITTLSMARTLRSFLNGELATHNIPSDNLETIELMVNLNITTVTAAKRLTNTQFARASSHKKFTQCHFSCQSRIATASTVYAREYSKIEEWPA